jgi:hypothetical protein
MIRPVFDGEVLYLDIHVFHHHFCHTQLSVFCVYLISSIPTYSHHLIRKGSSLQKFEMAEKMCSSPLPHPLWEHFYAKALNQYYDSLERLSPYKDGGLEVNSGFLLSSKVCSPD